MSTVARGRSHAPIRRAADVLLTTEAAGNETAWEPRTAEVLDALTLAADTLRAQRDGATAIR